MFLVIPECMYHSVKKPNLHFVIEHTSSEIKHLQNEKNTHTKRLKVQKSDI